LNSKKIVVVLVTYNKLELLKECLTSILDQTVTVFKILIVNNNSSDGTTEYLENVKSDLIIPKHLKTNIGGAGGFNIGIKEAIKYDADFLWVMDDDTIADKDALENLIIKNELLNGDFGFLASDVRWIDSSPCIMNVPTLTKDWNVSINKGIVKLESSSFVSMFINSMAVKQIGLPIKEFFIWGDDLEYSARISNEYDSYLVPESHVLHKMNNNTAVDLINENEKDRIERHFFDFRNRYFIEKKKGIKFVFIYWIRYFYKIVEIIFKSNYKFLKIKTATRGFFKGIFFNPEIEQYNSEV